ncbi:MAG: fumarylacetoacetate hydrolase family protein [Actinomycetota bacterium]|nr:fumarylacetoacetate hydrolase family protein [Actinomycetota bacterium]
MKIARVSYGGGIAFGVIEDDTVRELDGPPVGDLRFTGKTAPLSECRLLAPVLPSKIVAIGRNYAAHAAEHGAEVPKEPLLFLKPNTAVIGPDDVIRKPVGLERLDHEAELCVVIAGLVRNADEATAARAILGYTCGNDVSARDYQFGDGQWTRGKGFDTFAPLGPWIETELDPIGLQISARVNGVTKQEANTKDLVFPPAFLVSYISRVMTLLPGDVIMTGTPEGVSPMEPGDACEIEIEGIGVLRNAVLAAE